MLHSFLGGGVVKWINESIKWEVTDITHISIKLNSIFLDFNTFKNGLGAIWKL